MFDNADRLPSACSVSYSSSSDLSGTAARGALSAPTLGSFSRSSFSVKYQDGCSGLLFELSQIPVTPKGTACHVGAATTSSSIRGPLDARWELLVQMLWPFYPSLPAFISFHPRDKACRLFALRCSSSISFMAAANPPLVSTNCSRIWWQTDVMTHFDDQLQGMVRNAICLVVGLSLPRFHLFANGFRVIATAGTPSRGGPPRTLPT